MATEHDVRRLALALPETTAKPSYGTVLVRLPAVDAVELRELLTDAWLARAPTRVRKAHEGSLGG